MPTKIYTGIADHPSTMAIPASHQEGLSVAKADELRQKLAQANSLEDVQSLLRDFPGSDAARAYQELQRHRSLDAEKLDLNELDAVSGGADRDWRRDGCAATCEYGSWCVSNDRCFIFDVTYDGFWATCPDGHEHVYDSTTFCCVRCGYPNPDVEVPVS